VQLKDITGKGKKTLNRENFPLLLSLLWVLAAIIITGGCVTGHPSLAGGFFVETVPSSRVYLSNIAVRQVNDKLVISGEVSRRNAAFSGIGHLDVAVVSPDGMVVGQGKATYSPKILPKTPGARKHRPAHFELNIKCKPPQGSIVRVAYHGKSVNDDPLSDFQENYAIPKQYDYGG